MPDTLMLLPTTIPTLQMGTLKSHGWKKGVRLVSATPMSLNGKTSDSQGTNNLGFANTKEKMLTSHAPPTPSPKAQNFWEGPVSMT